MKQDVILMALAIALIAITIAIDHSLEMFGVSQQHAHTVSLLSAPAVIVAAIFVLGYIIRRRSRR